MTTINSHKQTSDAIEERVNVLLGEMTLSEKVGQMTQVEKNSITPEEVSKYGIGSVVSGGGGNPTPNTPQTWAHMVRPFQEAALQSAKGIPLLYGADAVHGHSNVVGASIFPHNIGLGAARDVELMKQIAQVTAREMLSTNVNWTFAPSVSVPQDIRWGRTYEGFSENSELVAKLGAALVEGYHKNNSVRPVLATVKHFIADGGTHWGTSLQYEWLLGLWQSENPDGWKIDQGDALIDESVLRSIHLPPYEAAISAGARCIMVSYSSWNGLKMHAHRYLLTDVLKGEMGFDGFLISDWLAVDQLDSDFDQSVKLTINAGVDMIMVPFDYKRFIKSLMNTIEDGDIPISRIDDAVRRILRVKFELGLFEQPFGDEELLVHVGSDEHRQIAREAVRKSQVLLKNESHTLPISSNVSHILIAGQAADDIGMQCGGWTIEWQGKIGDITSGTTLLRAIKTDVPVTTTVVYEPDGLFESIDNIAEIGIVVLSEPPYTEGEGDRSELTITADEIELVHRVRSLCQKLIIVLYSGRPLLINSVIDSCDAFVASWLPGTEGQGIADVLLGDYPFTGKLSFTWPLNMDQIRYKEEAGNPMFPYGYGLQGDRQE